MCGLWEAVSKPFEKETDREIYLEWIRISAADNQPTGFKVWQKQELDQRSYTEYTGKETLSQSSTCSCYRRCNILWKKFCYLRHTGAPPEEEPLCPGNTNRISWCVSAGKTWIRETRIHHPGDRSRRKARSEADLQWHTRSDVSFSSETNHHPLFDQQP